ncbi:MAG: Holliday junction resolvase RuvX [Patescibacteria group bacterium]|jgi:putative Holliday junction resolvase
MRLIGVDYGTRRIGLALADTDAPVAVPLETVAAQSLEADVLAVAKVAAREGATLAVIGLPRSLKDAGAASDWARQVAVFAAALAERGGLAVETEDERFSSGIVESARRSVGAKAGDVDKDAAAAAVILQSWLDRRPS